MKATKAASKELSSRARATKRRGLSERTRWAHCMQGANSMDLDLGALDWLTQHFGSYHPQWLIAARPWQKRGAGNFRHMREALHMTEAQCAAYMQLPASVIVAWESHPDQIPFAAIELLRLTLDSVHARASHQVWDGWFISADGAWVSPNVGRVDVKPHELDAWANTMGELFNLRHRTEKQRQEIEALQAENTRLRRLFQDQGLTRELRAMHERISALLEGVATADVIDFASAAAPGQRQEQAA